MKEEPTDGIKFFILFLIQNFYKLGVQLFEILAKNGTIELCPESHHEGIAPQTWNEIKNRATQIIVNKKTVNKYKQIKLPMKLGDVLFFNPYLFHRSGNNSTRNQIRFSLVGMWNDTTFPKF